MKQLSQADKFHLSAAEGWLELKNVSEAHEELENIPVELRGHPAVLKVRYLVFHAARKWEDAAEIARVISQLLPDDPFGYMWLAFSLHELRRTQEALETLLPVVDKFADQWVFPYNLSCYHCQLGDLTAAWKWLERAVEVAGKQHIRPLALEDKDLEPLWSEISAI